MILQAALIALISMDHLTQKNDLITYHQSATTYAAIIDIAQDDQSKHNNKQPSKSLHKLFKELGLIA